jgi:hypothetical protein
MVQTIVIHIHKQDVTNNNKNYIKPYNIIWTRRYLFGRGAVNAKIAGRWYKTPAMNSCPTVDIPYWEVPPVAINTFSPFWYKLRCTWDPEPMSSKAYLAKEESTMLRIKQSMSYYGALRRKL